VVFCKDAFSLSVTDSPVPVVLTESSTTLLLEEPKAVDVCIQSTSVMRTMSGRALRTFPPARQAKTCYQRHLYLNPALLKKRAVSFNRLLKGLA